MVFRTYQLAAAVRRLVELSLLALVLTSGCSKREREPQTSKGMTTIRVAGHPLKVMVCQTPQSRQRGLMFKKSLPPDEGMLFVFPQEGCHPFWMKNTYIPLSIAFINRDLEIIQIDEMEPLDTTSHTPLGPILYALETNKGWFKSNGIKVGDRVRF